MAESVSVEDTIKIAMAEGMRQLGGVFLGMAEYAEGKVSKEEHNKNPGKELYWMGYVDGLRDAARVADEGQQRLE